MNIVTKFIKDWVGGLITASILKGVFFVFVFIFLGKFLKRVASKIDPKDVGRFASGVINP